MTNRARTTSAINSYVRKLFPHDVDAQDIAAEYIDAAYADRQGRDVEQLSIKCFLGDVVDGSFLRRYVAKQIEL